MTTKTFDTIIATATTNVAAAYTTGSVVDLTSSLGGLLTSKISMGATPPTNPAFLYVYVSGDSIDYKLFAFLQASTTPFAVDQWTMDIPPAVMYLRADVTGNDDQDVDCEVFLQRLVSV